MSPGRLVARNVVWNWAGTVTQMAVGFFVAPVLIARLGEEGYGLWILIASLSGYFGLLDLGVCGAVGRQIAFHRARGDRAAVNATLGAAVAILAGAAVVALAGTAVASVAFFRVFDVPAGQVGAARVAIALVGLNLALGLLLNLFDATLWASQRFDVLNAVDVTAALARAGLTVALVGSESDLVVLAGVTLGCSVAAGLAKAVMSYAVDPGLRVRVAEVRREGAGLLFGFGVWYLALSAGRLANAQLGPLVAGMRLGVSAVTPFSVAARLTGYATALMIAATGVLTPVATAIHVREGNDRQRALLLEGGRYCLALSLFFTAVFVVLGADVLRLWLGPRGAASATLLVTLALGELVPLSQGVAGSVLLGMGRQRALALLGVAENAVAVLLALALLRPLGVVGIGVALAVSGGVFRGAGPLVASCRAVGVSLPDYVAYAVLPSVAAWVPSLAVLAVVRRFRTPENWGALVAMILLLSACHAAGLAVLLARGSRPNGKPPNRPSPGQAGPASAGPELNARERFLARLKPGLLPPAAPADGRHDWNGPIRS